MGGPEERLFLSFGDQPFLHNQDVVECVIQGIVDLMSDTSFRLAQSGHSLGMNQVRVRLAKLLVGPAKLFGKLGSFPYMPL